MNETGDMRRVWVRGHENVRKRITDEAVEAVIRGDPTARDNITTSAVRALRMSSFTSTRDRHRAAGQRGPGPDTPRRSRPPVHFRPLPAAGTLLRCSRLTASFLSSETILRQLALEPRLRQAPSTTARYGLAVIVNRTSNRCSRGLHCRGGEATMRYCRCSRTQPPTAPWGSSKTRGSARVSSTIRAY